MSLYTWAGLGQREDQIASGRLAAQIALNLPGMESLSITAKRDAALAELVAVYGGGGAFSTITISGDPAITLNFGASKLVGGATSFSIRDSTNANDNLLVSNAGVVTARSDIVTGQVRLTTISAINGVFLNSSLGVAIGNAALFQDNTGNTFVNAVTAKQIGFRVNNGASIMTVGPGTEVEIGGAVSGGQMFRVNGTMKVQGIVTLQNGMTINVGALTVLGGATGIGGTGNLSVGLYVLGNNPGGGTSQYGIDSDQTFPATGTSEAIGMRVRASTAAAAFTVTALAAIRIRDAVKGAGSTITTQYGLLIDNQTVGAANFAIFTGTGPVRFGDDVKLLNAKNLTWRNNVDSGDLKAITVTGTQLQVGPITAGGITDIVLGIPGSTIQTINGTGTQFAGYIGMGQAPSATALLGLTQPTGTIALNVIQQAGMTAEVLKAASGSLTGSSAIGTINIAQTWNTSGNPTAIKYLLTKTATGGASLMLDLSIVAVGSLLKVSAENGRVDIANQLVMQNIFAQAYGITVGSGTFDNTAQLRLTGISNGAVTSSYGARIDNTASSATTSEFSSVRLTPATQAAAFTCASVIGAHIDNATKGAGSTITTQYGIKIEDQSQGATNYALFSGTGLALVGDTFLVVGAPGTRACALGITNGTVVPGGNAGVIDLSNFTMGAGTGSTGRGILCNPVGYSGLTINFHGVVVQLRLPGTSFTLADARGLYVMDMSFSAGPTVTTQYGLKIDDQTKGVTNYGVYTGTGLLRFGDAMTVANRLGVGQGDTTQAGTVVALSSSAAGLTGTTQLGVDGDIAGTSAAAAQVSAFRGRAQTAAAAFTSTTVATFYARTNIKGAGSTITNNYGLFIEDQGSVGSSNWSIKTGTGLVEFGDSLKFTPATAKIIGGVTSLSHRNNADSADNLLIADTGDVTVRRTLITAASASGQAGLRLPHGAAPSSPVDGDMWTTTAGLFVRINGVTKTVTLT